MVTCVVATTQKINKFPLSLCTVIIIIYQEKKSISPKMKIALKLRVIDKEKVELNISQKVFLFFGSHLTRFLQATKN